MLVFSQANDRVTERCANLALRLPNKGTMRPDITSIQALHIALIDEATLLRAEDYLAGCERCVEDPAISFEYVLDALTGCDPVNTEYIMCRPAVCSNCSSQVTEKTLITA
jgi:hypothetical protein